MFTIDVCLVLNCFLFEKFYLHYALCDFDSIVLHCTELFIRQSVDREQIFDVTFQTPPIEKSYVRHWKFLSTTYRYNFFQLFWFFNLHFWFFFVCLFFSATIYSNV